MTGLQTHINSSDKSIKWTTEGKVETTVEKKRIEKKKKTLDFLDTVTVFRKLRFDRHCSVPQRNLH